MKWKVFSNKHNQTGKYRFAIYELEGKFKMFSSFVYNSNAGARAAGYKAIKRKMQQWDIYNNL